MKIEAVEGARGRWMRDLLADQTGSTYALMAAAMIPMLGFAGIGIDVSRTYMAQSRLQSAVDAAVLAAVRTEQVNPGTGTTPGSSTVSTVQAYVNGNMPTGFMGSARGEPLVSVARVGEEIRVTVTSTGTVPTSLMRVFGFENLPIRAQAVGVAGRNLPRAVEAMMVLDVTGSMDTNGGMTALKDSVNDFLNIVYGNSQTRNNFAIGMMPYNVVVNVGRLLPSARVGQIQGFTTRAATDPWGWKGCIYADPTQLALSTNINTIDANTFDMGNTLPGDTGVPVASPFMYPSMWVDSFHLQDNRYRLGETEADANAAANTEPMRTALIRRYGDNICRNPGGNDVACSSGSPNDAVNPIRINVNRIPDYATWPNPISYNSTVKPSNSDNHVSRSPNYVCPTEALPVSYGRTKADYVNYTANLQPLFNIGTWHNQAMSWAYRLMNRDDVFTRVRPNDVSVRQVVIFMTDGNFDSRDDGLNVNTRTPNFQRDTAYSGYGSYADRRLVVQGNNVSLNDARAAHRDATALRFAKTCQAMKRDGIELYTITFAISNNAEGDATREMFRTCATDRNTHFFETRDRAQLRAAFTTIAADLVDVHLEE
jgi:Flp pilus assembly protein TadG